MKRQDCSPVYQLYMKSRPLKFFATVLGLRSPMSRPEGHPSDDGVFEAQGVNLSSD